MGATPTILVWDGLEQRCGRAELLILLSLSLLRGQADTTNFPYTCFGLWRAHPRVRPGRVKDLVAIKMSLFYPFKLYPSWRCFLLSCFFS